jgi:hypothetical protein
MIILKWFKEIGYEDCSVFIWPSAGTKDRLL